MDVYTRLDPATGCSPQRALTDLVELWAAGVLPEDSTVWMDAGAAEPVLWALTDHSTLVYVYRPPCPGWVAVTKGRIRWGRTHREVKEKPVLDLSLERFPGGGRRRVMFVVASTAMTPTPVGVIADSKVQTGAMSGGRFTHSTTGITVIDLPVAQSARQVIDLPVAQAADPVTVRPAGTIEAASAMVAGVELLTAGLDPVQAAAVQAGLAVRPLDFTAEVLTDMHRNLVKGPRTVASVFAVVSPGGEPSVS